MKSTSASLRFVRTPSFRFPRWSILLRVAAILVVLAGVSAQMRPAQAAPAEPAAAHVYLIRGVLNIFSLGMDQMAATLQAQGINATVHNHMLWASIADDAAAEYKSGRVKTIILVGHSSGATCLPAVVARLSEQGVPVKLAIGLDSVFQTAVVGRVERYINFYVANGYGTRVGQTKGFQGKLENVDVETVPGVSHLTIDKNEAMQRKVIAEIDAAVRSGPVRSPVQAKQAKPRPPVARGTTPPAEPAAKRAAVAE
jgi:hypothetical protein